MEETNSLAPNEAPLPSKEYLAEGTENIYRTHICPKCRRCFKMHSHLQEHLRLHFPDPNLQCPTCSRFFTSRTKLRLHQLREAGEKTHRCHLCEYSAVEKNAIRRHVASVHPDEAEEGTSSQSFLCPTCNQSFLQSKALKAHMKTHNVLLDNTPLACFQEGCSFRSSERKDFMRHVSKEHGTKAAECRHHACGAVFQCEAEMEAHYRTHLAYHCSDCDFHCSNKSVFMQHRRLGHSGDAQLRCDFCPFVTFNPVAFERHVEHLHANEKIHRCSQCSYVTSHKRGLKRHMLMHTGEKPHKCSLCDFRCRDESYLSRHRLTHADDKNFMCAECGYVTRWKHYLTVHMRKHAGDLRYSCDQCSYRCHRMDQLKSHKLRHQAKSLMCEICAYACKRKYELRNHMLAKHREEEKRPAAFKCRYCTYTTCYKQALQNHENCKHTKLKEFGCALCDYSSFSGISLFLHKRKVHGYVPGDKAWLENYKAKEKERNAAEFVQDFYIKPSNCEQIEQPTVALDSHDSNRGTAASSQAVDSAFDVVSQEVVSDRSVSSPEQYCTLMLTTLTTTEDQTKRLQNKDESCKSSTPLNSYRSGSSTPAGSLEEDNVETREGLCEQSDLDEPAISTSQPVDDSPTVRSAFPTLQPESRLKDLKKHDKDQAEAMVLEGRVQMLVVPSEDVYHCDRCSYVTSKETALKYHCRASCQGRAKGHKCQACGAHFKQKRGLDCHLKKKCPTLPRKARTSVGISKTPASTESSAAGQEDSEQLERETSSDQMEILSSEVEIQEQEVHSSDTLTSSASEHPDSNIQTDKLSNVNKASSESVSLQRNPLYVKTDGKYKCKLCSFSSVQLPTVKQHVLSCREALNQKGNQLISDKNKRSSHKAEEDHVDKSDESLVEVSKKRQAVSCPNCAFKCSQKRALDSHQKKGCMKPTEVQCTLCSFVTKSTLSMSRHVLHYHKKGKLAKRLHCQRSMKQHLSLKHQGAQPHRCHYCPFSSTRRYRLVEHESLHTGVGRHTCDMCSKTFCTVNKLHRHKLRVHDKQPAHRCSLCDFRGFTPDDVRRHNRRCHTGELAHVCTRCDAQFSSEVALRNHCKRAHLLQTCFSCKKCDFTCSSNVTLKNHQQSRHPEAKCTTCQETFQNKQSLEIHQRTHLAHQCQLCSFATKTKQLFAQHLLGEHEGGPPEGKPLKCSTCQFVCRHQLVLEQHLRSHGTKRLYKCTNCEYATQNKQKITWHIRIHTGEKPYGCEQCSYTCSDPSRLKLHLRVHQEDKKYLCPDCGYKCKWATQLKYHMTKHTGEKPYACDQCDYRTNRADALRVHRDTQHCDTRPYVCEKCGKTFKTSFILKTHQQKHDAGRPYACGLCQKSFRWPAGLRHHYLSHTKQRPFCCRHCSYRAKQRFQVVKHLQRHHPEVPAEQGVLRDSEGGTLTLKEALQGSLNKTAADDQRPLTEVEHVAEEVAAKMQNA